MSKRMINGRMTEVADPNTTAVIARLRPHVTGEQVLPHGFAALFHICTG